MKNSSDRMQKMSVRWWLCISLLPRAGLPSLCYSNLTVVVAENKRHVSSFSLSVVLLFDIIVCNVS